MFYVMLCLLFLSVIVFGTVILTRITNRKWGYTEKREKELEKVEQKGGKL